MDVSIAWQNLEEAVAAVERGQGELEHLLETVAAGIYLLMEYPPHEVIAQVEASRLPTRATVSWLIFEAGRIKQIPPERVEGLRRAWEENYSHLGKIIPPHPAMGQSPA